MKTRLVSFLIVALLLLCACAETPPTTEQLTTNDIPSPEPTNESVTFTSPMQTETPRLNFVPGYGAFGGGKLVVLDDVQAELLTESETVEPLTIYPTYINPYPMNNSGIQFEVTPEMTEDQITTGQDFLSHYYGGDPSEYSFELKEDVADYVVWFKNQEMEAAVNPWRIHITLIAPYEGVFSVDALQEIALVQAALDWQHIDELEIREETVLNADGGEYSHEIVFAPLSDDPVDQLLNITYNSVKVKKFSDGLWAVSIELRKPLEIAAETPAVSAEQLHAFLTEAFPNDPPVGYVTEVFYSSKVESGKYTPCYRVYLPETDYPTANGQSVFSVIEVTTAEIVAADDLPTDIAVTEAPMSFEQTEMLEAIEEAEAAH